MRKLYYLILTLFGIVGALSATQGILIATVYRDSPTGLTLFDALTGMLLAVAGVLALLLVFVRRKSDDGAIKIQRTVGYVLSCVVMPLLVVGLFIGLSQTDIMKEAFCDIEPYGGSSQRHSILPEDGSYRYISEELSVRKVCGLDKFDVTRIGQNNAVSYSSRGNPVTIYGVFIFSSIGIAVMVCIHTRGLSTSSQRKS